MKYTPAQIKNLMRRGLRLLVDPEPEQSDKKRLKDYFKNSCAYCGRKLEKKDGDIDHLVSAALGGANGLANRVLSCKSCNAKEKRDKNWIEFLKGKCTSECVFEKRKSIIIEWIELNGGHKKLSNKMSYLLNEEAERVTKEYDNACVRIKKQQGFERNLIEQNNSKS